MIGPWRAARERQAEIRTLRAALDRAHERAEQQAVTHHTALEAAVLAGGAAAARAFADGLDASLPCLRRNPDAHQATTQIRDALRAAADELDR